MFHEINNKKNTTMALQNWILNHWFAIFSVVNGIPPPMSLSWATYRNGAAERNCSDKTSIFWIHLLVGGKCEEPAHFSLKNRDGQTNFP
jgi:hypothetical protein